MFGGCVVAMVQERGFWSASFVVFVDSPPCWVDSDMYYERVFFCNTKAKSKPDDLKWLSGV